KGFRIILRPRNWQGITPEVLRGLLADPVYEKAKGLVFFGDQVLGNGNAATLAEMASFLKTRNLFWGYTEFVGQKGETTLANLVPEQTVRIHSVPPDELKNYTPAEAKERFIRAVKERSIRLLYVRFFTEPSYDLWGKNITYLRSIIQDLNESGYSWGTVSPLKPFSPPFSVLILFALSVACASAVLYDFFLPGKWVILILVALLEIGSFFTGRLTGMKVMGVLAGMIFPTLALFMLIEGFQKKGKEIMVLFSALAMATAGGLVVSQGLYHWLYALRIEQYSGVKTSLIVPLVLVVLYLFKSGLLVGSSIQGVVLGGMKRYEFVILMVLAGGFVLYLTRSGNFPLLPAGLMESKMRLVLERALFMRPRTKEFLIGYPALWLLFTFCRTRLRPIYQLVLWLGVSVGFITFFNSFCHIHTPFLYILLRFGNAILLSVPIFVLYYLVIRIGLLVWNWMAYWGGSG
ncbi:MAG: DUF5693 family protein, partial [Atribacterota bacterium]